MKRILTLALLFVSLLVTAQTEGSYVRVTTVVDVFFSGDTLNVITTDSTFRDTIPVTVGPAGLSAYEIWLDEGNSGSITDFLNSLIGPPGATGDPGAPGNDGLSAYQIWLNEGNSGTEADFLNSLIGAPGATGDPGAAGSDGLSAYQIWLNAGNSGTEADFLASLKGEDGQDGVSAGDSTVTIQPDLLTAVAAATGTTTFIPWDTPITTSPSFYTTANAWEIGVNDSAFYRVKINVNFNRNPATNANFYDVYLIENSSGLIVDGSVQQSVFEINGSGFNFSNVNWSTSINGTFFLNGGETYSVRSNQNQDWEDCSISLEKVATQITIPIGPPGQQGEPGPASTVPGPPGPAGEDGFGIQLIGSVADSASLDPAYTGNVGDVFVADDTRNGFAWDGSVWINVGQIRGDDGLSAYQIWLANGNVGTEADFLESLKGADGAPGPPAPRENMAALRARNTVVTDINASTVDNLIPWETTDFSDPLFSRPTDTRIQVDSAGLYYVSGGITATSTVGNSRYNGRVKLRINGSTVEPMRSATGYIRVASGQDETTLTWNYFINLNEGDYFEILVDQENTISAVVNTLPGESYLNVVLLESLAPQISNGQDGLSAYEIWLDNGNSGTEADFLNSLVGPPGTNGTNGTNGTDGRNGEQWFLGSGIPSAGLGEDGDLYLQTDVTAPGDVYEKQSGNWVYQYTLELNGVGPAGDDGNEWTVSNSVPSVGETVGDLHLQTADDSPGVAGDIWRYNGTTWVIIHNIQGTPGAQGERGATWTISTTSPAFVANVNDLHLQTEDDGSGDKGDIWKYNGTVWQPAGNIAGQDAVAWPDGTTFGTTSNTTFTVASGSVYNLSNSGSSQLTVNFNGVNLIDGQSIVINCTKSGTGNILLASTGEGITYEGSTAALYTTSGTKTFIAVKAAGRLYITSSTFLD